MLQLPNVDDVMAASGLITAVPGGVESSSEVVPHTRVIDGVNLRSPDFQRLLAGGVTTVSISPAPFAVIGPRSAIVRTAGPMRDRIVIAEHAVEAVVSSDAYRVGGGNQPPFRTRVTERTRRPTTRMGLAWVFRKAFADTIRRDEGLPITGSDAPSDAAMDILEQVLAGSIPLSIHSRTATDIASALNMTEEFGLTFTLLEGTEADRMTTELASRNISVVFGPIYIDPSGPRAFTDETSRKRLGAVRTIHDAGLRMAITAQDLREEAGLVRQAMYAVRAGLSPAHAIRAVTLTPARSSASTTKPAASKSANAQTSSSGPQTARPGKQRHARHGRRPDSQINTDRREHHKQPFTRQTQSSKSNHTTTTPNRSIKVGNTPAEKA